MASFFNKVYDTRNPKGLKDGVGSGVENIVRGVGGGLVSFATSPVNGARNEGAVGLAKGLLVGAVSVVALPVCGVLVGSYQIVRGATNATKVAANEQDGMIWDGNESKWTYYSLEDEAEKVREATSMLAAAVPLENSSCPRKAKDLTYYNVLGVPSNSSPKSLKNAYYKAARSCHPDHHPNDPQAEKTFQELSAAYLVLSDPDKRSHYDKHGITSSDGLMFDLDPTLFFNMLLGSEAFYSYVGDLWIASIASYVVKGDLQSGREEGTGGSLEKELKQRKREIEISFFLRDKISVWKTLRDEEVCQLCEAEAERLREGKFGGLFCHVIGSALKVAADSFFVKNTQLMGGLAVALQSGGSEFRSRARFLGSAAKAAHAGFQAYSAAKRLAHEKDNQDKTGGTVTNGLDSIDKTLAGAIPATFEFVWAVTSRDIEKTLQAACKRLFLDGAKGKPLTEKLREAELLYTLGSSILAQGQNNSSIMEGHEASEHFHKAAMATYANAQGQDFTE